MPIRVLMAIPDIESQALMRDLLQAALCLVPHELDVVWVGSRQEMLRRVRASLDDVIFLDWALANSETPQLIRDLVQANPRIRTVVLLPMQLRQYRQCLWEAGACSSIPKENLDQEWLSSALCFIRRAMEREARLEEKQLWPAKYPTSRVAAF